MSTVSTDRRQGVNAGNALKTPCRVATTASITLAGLQTIDGIALAQDDRVMVKDQATASENGIYTADTGAWSRALDFDGPFDVVKGTVIHVTDGTLYARTWWEVTTSNPITPGTTSLALLQGITDAGIITFVQSGTGAFPQNVQGRERKTFLLTDFQNTGGTQVLGNGTTDNTSGLVAALLAAKTASEAGAEVELKVPAGNYKLATGGSMPFLQAARVKVTGDGMANTTFTIPASTNPASAVIWSMDTEAELTDLTLNYASNAAHGVRSVTTVNNIAVRRVRCIGTSSNAKGIFIRTATNAWVEDCVVDNQTGTPDIGIHLTSCVNAFVTGNVVTYTQQTGGSSAIRSDGGSYVHLDGNHCTGGNIFHLDGGVFNTSNNNTVKQSSGDAISFGTAWGNPAQKYTQCVGNSVDGSTDYCYSWTNCQYMTASGNTARNASTGGYGLVDCKYNTLTACIAVNCGQQNFTAGGDTVRNGFIVFESGAGRSATNMFVGCISVDDQGTHTQRQGFNSNGTATYTTFIGCFSFGSTIAQFAVGATDLIKDIRDAETGAGEQGGAVTFGIAFGGSSTGITYGANTGTYTKNGKLVVVRGRITLTSKGAQVGNATITGLPIAAADLNGVLRVSFAAAFAAGITSITGYASTSVIQLQVFGAGVTANITDASFTNTSDLIFEFSYESAGPV